jgi:hypothetical protein
LDSDVLRCMYDPLVGIGIFYLAIRFQMLNRCRVVKWLMVVQRPILKFNTDTVYEYIVIIWEHQSTDFKSPVFFNFCNAYLFKVGKSKIYSCITESGEFDISAYTADMNFSQMIDQL